MANKFTEDDLKRLGLEEISPGQYRKKKTVLQPREYKNHGEVLRGTEKITGNDKVLVALFGKTEKELNKYVRLEGRIEVKPMSVNGAWKGRRYKTDDYKAYEQGVLSMLKNSEIPAPPYKLSLTFGISSRNADIDNPAKLFIDILQKKYKFNDKEIFELNIKKIIVAKRKEYCEFKMESL